MTTPQQITPFLHVADLARARDLLTRVLPFRVVFEQPGYLYLEWGAAALRVLEEPARPLPARGEKVRLTVYVDVPDVDALHEQLRPGLETLPPGEWWPPCDKSWGQRELHVRLPDGQWLAFGAPVRTAPDRPS